MRAMRIAASCDALRMIDPDRLLALPITPRHFSYTERDTMLYALGVGFGSDPLDRDELRFVYEDKLVAMPTQATVVAWDRSWIADSGIPWARVVHGEQRTEMHRQLPPAADIVSTARVSEVLDKGSGALVRVETRIALAASGDPLCTIVTGFFVRGAGGFDRRPGLVSTPRLPFPSRAPDAVDEVRIAGNQALLYRLCGDRNPHHASPDAALASGFERPLLHGLCTYGFACRSVLKRLCDWDAARVASFDARFSAPVYPGDTISFDMWREAPDRILVRARCLERAPVVLEGSVGLRTV